MHEDVGGVVQGPHARRRPGKDHAIGDAFFDGLAAERHGIIPADHQGSDGQGLVGE